MNSSTIQSGVAELVDARKKIIDAAALQTRSVVRSITSLAGSKDPVIIPGDVARHNWELQVAVIMAKKAGHISREALPEEFMHSDKQERVKK